MRTCLFVSGLALGAVALPACEDGATSADAATEVDASYDFQEPLYFGYRAIVIDDSRTFDGDCSKSASRAHGADIDAVELRDGRVTLGWLTESIYEPGTACDVASGPHADDDAAEGPADGTLDAGYVSLGGGRLVSEFSYGAKLLLGYSIVVYEIGDEACRAAGLEPGVSCVGDEPYEVSIIHELSCLDQAECEPVQLSLGAASGIAEMPVAGF